MAQVSRQYHKAFQQRRHQNTDHHQRNIAQNVADNAAHHQQRHKRSHRGQGRGQHRPHHALGGAFGGVDGLLSQAGMGVGILAHHDGVIHNHPQSHDQGKQRHHVDRATQQPQHRQRGHKGGGNADGHPGRHPPGQKQVQQGDHQHQAA